MPHDAAPVVLDYFWSNLYYAHKLLFCNFWQNSDIGIRFSHPDFLEDSYNLANRRRFRAVTLTFDTWPLTFVVHLISRDQTLPNFTEIEQSTAELLIIL